MSFNFNFLYVSRENMVFGSIAYIPAQCIHYLTFYITRYDFVSRANHF